MEYLEYSSDYDDDDKVTYCANCYSLSIKEEDGLELCTKCGCLDTHTATFEEWEALYENRYKKKFVERNKNIRDSFIFKLPLDKLKSKVFNLTDYKKLINEIYPSFPKGLGRADSIVLLFDKVIKDNKLDLLREKLINFLKKK